MRIFHYPRKSLFKNCTLVMLSPKDNVKKVQCRGLKESDFFHANYRYSPNKFKDRCHKAFVFQKKTDSFCNNLQCQEVSRQSIIKRGSLMHYSNAVFLLFFLKDFSLSFDHAKRTDQLKWPEHYYKLCI